MWAQLIKMQLKPGADTAELNRQLRAAEEAGSGLIRPLMMRDQKCLARSMRWSCSRVRKRAREREQDPRRQERLQSVRALMEDLFASPPEFVDLTVDEEWTG